MYGLAFRIKNVRFNAIFAANSEARNFSFSSMRVCGMFCCANKHALSLCIVQVDSLVSPFLHLLFSSLNLNCFFGAPLTKVWAIADSKREGYLGFKEFVISMQVIFFIKMRIIVLSEFDINRFLVLNTFEL